jgi:hypothetical protein
MEGKTLPLPLGEGFGRRGASVRSRHQPLPPPSVRFAAQVLKGGRDWLVQQVAWTPASGRPLGFCLDLNVRTARAIAQSTGGRAAPWAWSEWAPGAAPCSLTFLCYGYEEMACRLLLAYAVTAVQASR